MAGETMDTLVGGSSLTFAESFVFSVQAVVNSMQATDGSATTGIQEILLVVFIYSEMLNQSLVLLELAPSFLSLFFRRISVTSHKN